VWEKIVLVGDVDEAEVAAGGESQAADASGAEGSQDPPVDTADNGETKADTAASTAGSLSVVHYHR
jgi:hypothetical protein